MGEKKRYEPKSRAVYGRESIPISALVSKERLNQKKNEAVLFSNNCLKII
jgi:hypothetical protein